MSAHDEVMDMYRRAAAFVSERRDKPAHSVLWERVSAANGILGLVITGRRVRAVDRLVTLAADVGSDLPGAPKLEEGMEWADTGMSTQESLLHLAVDSVGRPERARACQLLALRWAVKLHDEATRTPGIM